MMQHTTQPPKQYTPYIEQQVDIENRIIDKINANQESKLEYIEKDISVQLKKIIDKIDTQIHEINVQHKSICCSYLVVIVLFIVFTAKVYTL